MKILITGHRGFVGRAFIRKIYPAIIANDPELSSSITGIDIKGYDRMNSLGTNNTGSGIDCRDFFKTSDEKYDLVIHLAAIVGGRMKIEGDPISVATDLSIDSEMWNWAVRTKQPRVVYFSSSAAYPIKLQEGRKHKDWTAPNGGTGQKLSEWEHKLSESDINLEDIKNPDMSYGMAKLVGEMLAEYARKAGVKTYVFRPFSGYGEDQDLDYPFPSFMKRIKDKVPEFEIWGDGRQTRDFIHIDDIVEAVMKAVELDIQEPINLGSGAATSFNELAAIAMEISGHKVPIVHRLEKPVGVQYRVSDNSKMLELYKPKISLEEGIRRSLNA